MFVSTWTQYLSKMLLSTRSHAHLKLCFYRIDNFFENINKTIFIFYVPFYILFLFEKHLVAQRLKIELKIIILIIAFMWPVYETQLVFVRFSKFLLLFFFFRLKTFYWNGNKGSGLSDKNKFIVVCVDSKFWLLYRKYFILL